MESTAKMPGSLSMNAVAFLRLYPRSWLFSLLLFLLRHRQLDLLMVHLLFTITTRATGLAQPRPLVVLSGASLSAPLFFFPACLFTSFL